MKRDDFGMRIDEIRELATKYSKQDLARMVKMGLIDPQRALMAGMMIDRIAKSAMEPPQTTVVEDVLAAPTTAQGQIPAGIMGAPQAPAPSPGVAGLPSGMQNMAGGGIVAFAEGGDTDDIPGYAGDKESLVDSRRDPAMKIDPRVQAKRDRDRYQILAQELRDAQNRMMRGEPGAKSDFEAIQREMRSVKPSRAMTGLETLIPSAEAATPTSAKAPRPAAAPVEEEAAYDPMTGLRITGPEPKPYDPRIKPGTVYEPNIIRDILQGGPGAKPAAPSAPEVAKPAPAAPSKFQVEEAPPPRTEEPAARAPGFERPGKIEAEQLAMPQERTAKELYQETEQMYGEAGVDTNLYKNMMQELREKKAGMKDRKEQALGLALMSFGIDLAGARQGQEFERLGMAGQRALGMYVNSMDKIVDNEDKIEALQRQVRLEENNYRRTGADSALARRDRLLARADNIAAKNAELKQDAAKANSQILADLYKTDVYSQVRTQDTAARIAAALGANRGGYTEPQLSKLISDIEMQYGPQLREKNKHLGSKEQIEKAVQEELDKLVLEHINKVKGIRQKGGIPVPSSGAAPWQVQSGVD